MENDSSNRSAVTQIALIVHDNDKSSEKNIQTLLDFIELTRNLPGQNYTVLNDIAEYLRNELSGLKGKKIVGNNKLRRKIEDSQKVFTGEPSAYQEVIKKIRAELNRRIQLSETNEDLDIAQKIIDLVTPPMSDELLNNSSLDEIFSAISGLELSGGTNKHRQQKWSKVEDIVSKLEKQLNIEGGIPKIKYLSQLEFVETTLLLRDSNRTKPEVILTLISMTELVERYSTEKNETVKLLSEYLKNEHHSLASNEHTDNNIVIRKRIEKDILKFLYPPQDPYYD